MQETKNKNTPEYDFNNEEKLSERFDDCRQVKRILQRLLQEIKKNTPQYDFTSETR